MTSVVHVPLGDLMATKTGSVDPSKYENEAFDLYSIPAYDRGAPEVAEGSAIGSAKQVVEPQDVLLSKIVPHIRRTWVVGEDRGRRLIASGEWIVFRSPRAEPAYLRQVLRSDPFHVQFMQTVAGVGGSLLRARPAQVARVSIPLPSLPEQRRIAAILDQADALRAKRREALAQLDSLTQSIFIEMFGDPATNPKRWPEVTISEICDVKGGKRLPKGEDYSMTPTPFRYIRVTDIRSGSVDESRLLFLRPEVQSTISRYIVNAGDVIISIAGSIGLIAPVSRKLAGANLTENAAKLVPRVTAPAYDHMFLAKALQTPFAQDQISSHVGQVTIGKLALFRIEKVRLPLPPIDAQREFAKRVDALAGLRHAHQTSNEVLDVLFASLQHRAFAGQLS